MSARPPAVPVPINSSGQVTPNFPIVHQSVPAVDPGMMVAMSQVKIPTLEGLKISQIKSFRTAYSRYESKCPVENWKRLPGQLLLPEHLLTVARINGIDDLDDLRKMEVDAFLLLYVEYITRL
jgi:hypothetical protein